MLPLCMYVTRHVAESLHCIKYITSQICGVTSEADCELALSHGADLIGMIMWPMAKRSVSDATAAAICACAARHGARAVGVFVDEDASTIVERAERAGLHFAQLHGDGARAALHEVADGLGVVYVMHAAPDGTLQTQLPSEVPCPHGRQPRKVCCLALRHCDRSNACSGCRGSTASQLR
jgi:N-(5'phosphoribosyl)anthranilate (PRA) isomerase